MTDAMIAMKVKPWQTPNFANIDLPPRPKQEGMTALPSIAVEDLPIETLDSLVNQWRVEMYAKARKSLPEDRK